MKTRNKIILITSIAIVVLVGIPALINLATTSYCNSVQSDDCVIYSISLIPNFGHAFDDMLYKDKSKRLYDTSPATCNDFTGKADGQCFLKALQECRHASIKNMNHSVEGDPIYYYAYIDVDDCLPRYSVDARQDRFAGQDSKELAVVCDDAKLDINGILFTCEDESHLFFLD